MVGISGQELNLLFDTLADWNTVLEHECPDVYTEDNDSSISSLDI